MDYKEKIIRKYFEMWLRKNADDIGEVLDDEIYYSECYGPEYHGLNKIKKWFFDWNIKGTVIEWDIKQFIHQGNQTVVEWYFNCNYDGNTSGFDGISLIEFNNSGKICSLKEFQSKSEHYSPYHKI